MKKIFIFTLLLPLLMSCQTFEEAWLDAINGAQDSFSNENPEAIVDGGKIEYVLTFHRMPNSAQKDLILRAIPDAGSQDPVMIHGVPYCQSRDIEEIRIMDSEVKPGFKRLWFKLSPQGKRRWSQMVATCMGEPIAVVIDGEFHRSFVPTQLTDIEKDDWVTINADFPPKLSRNLWKHSKRNFKHFAKGPFDF